MMYDAVGACQQAIGEMPWKESKILRRTDRNPDEGALEKRSREAR